MKTSLLSTMLPVWILLAVNIVSGHPANLNFTSSQDLQRRQCVWEPVANDWVCNNFLTTLAQHVYALRDTQNLGRVAPEKIMFFYSNLFEPGETSPSLQRVAGVVQMAFTWLLHYGYDFSDILSVSNSLTPAGYGWYYKNENWISQGPGKQFIATLWDSTERALFLHSACFFQALALSNFGEFPSTGAVRFIF